MIHPKIVSTFVQFVQNFSRRYEYDVWGTCVDWDTFVVAGGSIVCSLLAHCPIIKSSDIDLFYLKENVQTFMSSVVRILKFLLARAQVGLNLFLLFKNDLERQLRKKYFVRKRTAWFNRVIQFDLFRRFKINDIFNGKDCSPTIIIQAIYPTIIPINVSRIIHSFDLDICSAAFDSNQISITFGCLQALNSGHTTCCSLPASPSQFMSRASRFLKYQQRGFNVLCPKQFNLQAFLSTDVKQCNESHAQRSYRFYRTFFGVNCDSFSMQEKFCEYYNLF